MLSAELAQLMQVPVLPEPVSASARSFLLLRRRGFGRRGRDPQMLLSVLTGIGLSELMSLSVYSGTSLLQETGCRTGGRRHDRSDQPLRAEFLHNMLSLPLPDLMSVGPLQNLFLTDYADHPGHFDFVWNLEPPESGGRSAGDGASPSDHHPEQPASAIDTLPVRRRHHPPHCSRLEATSSSRHHGPPATLPPGICTTRSARRLCRAASTPAWRPRSATIPHKRSAAAPAMTRSWPAASPTRSMAASGFDAVSYADSGPIVVLLQDTDTHGPHANEPAGGSGGFCCR